MNAESKNDANQHFRQMKNSGLNAVICMMNDLTEVIRSDTRPKIVEYSHLSYFMWTATNYYSNYDANLAVSAFPNLFNKNRDWGYVLDFVYHSPGYVVLSMQLTIYNTTAEGGKAQTVETTSDCSMIEDAAKSARRSYPDMF